MHTQPLSLSHTHTRTHTAQRLPRNLVSAKSTPTGREWPSFHKAPWTLSITQTPHSNTQHRRSNKQNTSNINGEKAFSSAPLWPFPTSRMSTFLISLTDYQTITRESLKTALVARGQYSRVSECNESKRASSCVHHNSHPYDWCFPAAHKICIYSEHEFKGATGHMLNLYPKQIRRSMSIE